MSDRGKILMIKHFLVPEIGKNLTAGPKKIIEQKTQKIDEMELF